MRHRPCFLVAAALVAACGSAQAPAPADAGSGSGGVGDAGVGADAGGSPSADAGNGGTDAGSGGSGSGGGSADAGMPDAGGGGGGQADECAGLRPADPGAAAARHSMQGMRVDCAAGVTDGNGSIALAISNVLEPSNGAVHFLQPDGVLLAQNTSTNAVLTGQLSGFEGRIWESSPAPGTDASKLRAWDTGGRTVAEGPVRSGFRIVHEDPLGGIMVVDFSSSPKTLESYDERLNLRWRVDIIDRGVGGFAVDRAGRTLVLFDADYATAPQAVDAVWVDHDGTKGPIFRALGRQSSWPHLGIDVTQRVGSGLFFRADQWWQIDSLATVVQPPPDWFARRPFSGLHMVHGGTGYAVFPSSCQDTIEVVAPSGASCGTATFSAGSGSCAARGIAVGYDGTVIQKLRPPDGECNGGSCTCTWQWWPGFFR